MADMKLIPLGIVPLAEFHQPDHDLSKAALARMLSQVRDWRAHDKGIEYGQFGYVNAEKSVPVWDDELFQWIMRCVAAFSQHFVDNAELAVVDTWLTRSQLGNRGSFHGHPNSMISGVYYFEDHPSGLEFQTLNSIKQRWAPLLCFDSPTRSHNTVKVSCEQGKLVLFDSQLQHAFEKVTTRLQVRYSLALNLFPTRPSTHYTNNLQYSLRSAQAIHKEYFQSLSETN